ncbi:hypothetical protein GFC30_2964 [Anoxybacillus amylolyticus]|uniref:Uncharacterized protein n=1 Tax=Anoxybacteroides amylolyticum TaxID=294699 RepID=A0A160F1F2_9BACL|nr:hypothetical protein GFC30_2964 [Anoxybacillus amylolyticus]
MKLEYTYANFQWDGHWELTHGKASLHQHGLPRSFDR